jgi:hypothetical protein
VAAVNIQNIVQIGHGSIKILTVVCIVRTDQQNLTASSILQKTLMQRPDACSVVGP